jgi:hypothetical protein
MLLLASGIGGGSVQLIYLLLGTLQIHVLNNLMGLVLWSSLVGFFRRTKLVYLQIAIGVCTVFSCVYAILTATVFQEVTWAPYKATQQVQGLFDVFTPNDPSADYVVRQFGIQGAGTIKLTLVARSDRDQSINVSLIQFGSDVRFDEPCQLRTTETTCEVTGVFADRLSVAGAFGGFRKREWKQGDAKILVTRFEMHYLERPSLSSYLQNIPRVKSVYFNENAFGAVSALLCLMSWFVFNKYVGTVLAAFNLMSILLSGSQNSLLVVAIGPNLFQSFRIFNASPGERNLERVEIWNQYVRSGFASSLVFGRGTLDVPGLGTTINARHGHNLWVQSFYQGGLLGLSGMLALWLLVFWKGLARLEPTRVSILVCILILNLFDYTFYFWPVQLIFWFTVIAWKPRV